MANLTLKGTLYIIVGPEETFSVEAIYNLRAKALIIFHVNFYPIFIKIYTAFAMITLSSKHFYLFVFY